MFVKQVQVESLGDSSYLVGSDEAKVCVVVDPLRDVDTYIHEAEALGGGPGLEGGGVPHRDG